MARKGLNIHKRKDGRWEARYIKSRNTQGKPRYGYLYATSYHEARNNLQKVIQVLNATDNEKVPATNNKFMDFSVIWLENSLSSLKESTYIRYRILLNCYLMPSFQQFQMSEITRERVCTFCKGLETSVYKGYKQDKIEMRGDRAEMSDFPLYLNTVAGGLDRRDQTIGGFSFVVKIYAVPVVEIIG